MMRRRNVIKRTVRKGLKSGVGAGSRSGRVPSDGTTVVNPVPRKRQRKPAKPKMRVGNKGK